MAPPLTLAAPAALRPRSQLLRRTSLRRTVQRRRHEPVPDFHSATSRDLAADGGGDAGGIRGLPATAGFSPARGGLPDDSGHYVLSGCVSRCNGVFGHRPAGAATRRGPRTEPNDLDEFIWQF